MPNDDAHPHHHHHPGFDDPATAESTEVEGEVLLGLATAAAEVVADECRRRGLDVRRVVDLGCGPGVGTGVLASIFPDAAVLGADGSPAMVARARQRAARLGLTGRVHHRLVSLPDDLPSLDRADVVWASMVLHHIGDEVAALRAIHEHVLARHGVLALVEHAGPIEVLPHDLGRPGLASRLDDAWAAWFATMRADIPDAAPSADLAAMVASAGYEVRRDEVVTEEIDPPLDDGTRDFVDRQVRRMLVQLEHHGDAADLAAVASFVDGHAEWIERARIRAPRRLVIATPER